jgi:hypothetical protein
MFVALAMVIDTSIKISVAVAVTIVTSAKMMLALEVVTVTSMEMVVAAAVVAVVPGMKTEMLRLHLQKSRNIIEQGKDFFVEKCRDTHEARNSHFKKLNQAVESSEYMSRSSA